MQNISYVPIDHPEVEGFLDGKKKELQGVKIAHTWLNEMKNGDKDKQDVWRKLIEHRSLSGYPYIIFVDRM